MCIAVHILNCSLHSRNERATITTRKKEEETINICICIKLFSVLLYFQALVDVNLIRFAVAFFVDDAVVVVDIVVSMSKHNL